MHSDCHTNEPGSIVWQSEHTLICSDGTSSHCPPLRFMHTGIPRASTNRTSLIQSSPHIHTHKCFTHLWGPSHRGQSTWGSLIQFYRHSSDDLTAGHPTSDTIAKGEQGHPTWTRTQVYRVPNMLSDRHTKEPSSVAWQPESIFNRRDDHIVTVCVCVWVCVFV